VTAHGSKKPKAKEEAKHPDERPGAIGSLFGSCEEPGADESGEAFSRALDKLVPKSKGKC
jgi:hypothetical protein